MSTARLESVGDGKFRIAGRLDYDTVKQLLDHDDNLFAHALPQVTVDLGGIERTTSVGLALMLEWLRQAHSNHKSIHFINVPQQIQDMAKISQLETILHLSV